jgi:hypothetical protein
MRKKLKKGQTSIDSDLGRSASMSNFFGGFGFPNNPASN